MISIMTQDTMEKAAALFSGMKGTMITSCLTGTMGKVYLSDNAAAAYLGDLSFYIGTPDEELLRFKPDEKSGFVIMVPGNPAWEPLLEETYGRKAKKIKRYAIRKDTVFDREHLNQLKSRLPDGFSLEPLGQDVYDYCRKNFWCQDWVSQFSSFEDYSRRGLGMVVKKEGVPVAGASSYYVYPGGIEIQIDTHQDFRRRGLATAAAAGLILQCLDRGIYPSWDAANLSSEALAEKLGYQFDYEYDAYEVNW